MAKIPEQLPPTTFDQTLEDFCRELSATDSRVELIAAFFAHERANDRLKDSAEAFRARLAEFATKPVA